MLLCSWSSSGKHIEVGSHAFLQGIFPTQGLNPGLLHWRQIHYHLNHQRVCVELLHLCPNLCDHMDCSLSDSSVHGILQARILGWGAISSSKGIFPTEGSNPCLLCLLCWQAGSLPVVLLGRPCFYSKCFKLLPIKVIDEWFRPVLWCRNGETYTLWIYRKTFQEIYKLRDLR